MVNKLDRYFLFSEMKDKNLKNIFYIRRRWKVTGIEFNRIQSNLFLFLNLKSWKIFGTIQSEKVSSMKWQLNLHFYSLGFASLYHDKFVGIIELCLINGKYILTSFQKKLLLFLTKRNNITFTYRRSLFC